MSVEHSVHRGSLRPEHAGDQLNSSDREKDAVFINRDLRDLRPYPKIGGFSQSEDDITPLPGAKDVL